MCEGRGAPGVDGVLEGGVGVAGAVARIHHGDVLQLCKELMAFLIYVYLITLDLGYFGLRKNAQPCQVTLSITY